ncbi:hypothetical protein HUG10_20320 (plasmid) [Halorarum halophilum]|uniref:Uncharacterized protein n=1 Tax=Halorarum halophilum TaxID=2743090 RepID=A0A7D5GPH6_9EURY|nr:hypothetical protein [Halobaculum halophilum]QLG29947.1 hypothetical protein HUG10_20320 [Halobaculum halophilum]
MKRYEPKCAGETLYLVADNDRLKVGFVDDVVNAVGGDTHAIKYDEKQQTQPWLETDDGILEIDIRETVTTLNHTEETVAELREYAMQTDRYGLPTRTVEFANVIVDILNQQGRTNS